MPGKFPPRPGPAFVVGGSRSRAAGAPAPEKFGGGGVVVEEGDGLVFFPLTPFPPSSQLHGDFWGSRRPQRAVPPPPPCRLPPAASPAGGPKLGLAGLFPAFLGWGFIPEGDGCWSRLGVQRVCGGVSAWAPPKEAESAAPFFLGALIMFFFLFFIGPCSGVIFKALFFLHLEDAHRSFYFFFLIVIAEVFIKGKNKKAVKAGNQIAPGFKECKPNTHLQRR